VSFGAQLKKLRIAAGLTVEAAAKAEGVSKRLWEYWEAGKKLPPAERDAITRERLLARWKTKARPPGSSNVRDEQRARTEK
jgi:transcriptional regulator with XRE-family HTH domain